MKLSICPQDFSSLEEDWQRLLPSCGTNTVFSTPSWQKVWWEHFGLGKEPWLLKVSVDDRLIGVAPLMQAEKTLSFIGDPEICDYLDFAVAQGEEERFYAALLGYLGKQDWGSLDLHAIPDYSKTLSVLPGMAQAQGYSVNVTVEDVCPRANLGATWENYLAGLNRKDRHELRRKLRRLYASGDVRSYAISNASLASDMGDFLQLHRVSREDKAHFMNEEMEAFFRAVTASLASLGYLKLFFMEFNGIRVSSALCFDYANELSLYNSGYDPAYSDLSVGLLIKALCLKEAIDSGRRRFDFLRGEERYKYHLGGVDLPVHHCQITRGKVTPLVQ